MIIILFNFFFITNPSPLHKKKLSLYLLYANNICLKYMNYVLTTVLITKIKILRILLIDN